MIDYTEKKSPRFGFGQLVQGRTLLGEQLIFGEVLDFCWTRNLGMRYRVRWFGGPHYWTGPEGILNWQSSNDLEPMGVLDKIMLAQHRHDLRQLAHSG